MPPGGSRPVTGPRPRRARPPRSRAPPASKAAASDRLDSDGHGVVGRSGLDDEPMGPVVVAPRVRCRDAVGSPGTRPTTSARNGVEAVGVGHLEDEVAEFELVVHWSSSREVTTVVRGEEPRRVRSKRVDERGRTPSMLAAAAATIDSGVKGSRSRSGGGRAS